MSPEEKEVAAMDMADKFYGTIAPQYQTHASIILGNLFALARGKTDYQNSKVLKTFLKRLEKNLDT